MLHGGLHAAVEHVDGVRREHEACEEARGLLASREGRRTGNGAQIVEVRLDAVELCLRQRSAHGGERGVACCAFDDDLRKQRIVERADFGAGIDPCVDPCIGGERDMRQHTRARLKLFVRIFRVQADLDARPAGRRHQCVERCKLTLSLADHPLDQIDARHLLRDAMLDLQPRVHFEEVEAPRVGVEYELDRAGGFVLHGLRETHGARMQCCAFRLCQAWRGCLLDHLLIAPLHRAVAFAKCDHAATAVAENLHFNVARVLDKLLDIDTRVRKVGLAEPCHRCKHTLQLRRIAAQRHADAAAARRAFQHHGIDDRLGLA